MAASTRETYPGRIVNIPRREPKKQEEHKEHKGLKKALLYGLSSAVVTVGVLTGAGTFNGKNHGGDIIPPTSTTETFDPTETTTEPTTETTQTPTTETTQTPTTETTPAPTESLTEEQKEELALQEKLTLATELEGAQKVIQEIDGLKRIVYIAEAGNPYGVEAGSYLGESKAEAKLNGEDIEIVGFTSAVVKYILQSQLDKMPDDQEKYLIPLPVDISNLKTLGEVKVNIEQVSMFKNHSILSVDCGGKTVSVINILPKQQKITCFYSVAADNYIGILSENSANKEHITPGNEMDFLFVMLKTDKEKISEINGKTLNFGDKLGETSEKIYIGVNSGMEGREPSEENILYYDGAIVSLTSNN